MFIEKRFIKSEDIAPGEVKTPNIGDGQVTPAKTANLGVLKSWSASPTPGVSGAYGSAVALKPSVNKGMVPLMVKLSWGGTFGTGETVTIRLTVKYSDGSTTPFSKSATATGDYWLTDADKSSLWKDGVYITEIDVDSSSSLASTTVTTSATIYGIEI